MKANSEYGHAHQHVRVFFLFPQKSILAKMTTNMETEKFPESKAVAIPVKQPIIWRNVVLLTVIHLATLYATVDVVPRCRIITFVWRKWGSGLSVTHLHMYLRIPVKAL
jgi:hypothetical protein